MELSSETFQMVPASARAQWFLGVSLLIVAAVLVLLAWVAYSSRRASFEVSGAGLTLRGDLWGRTLALTALDVQAARRLDLDQEPGYTPRRRTLGTGLPGYSSGWFRLRNGEKALIYVTDRDRLVYVPTHVSYSVLLSVDRPDRFLEALRGAAGAAS